MERGLSCGYTSGDGGSHWHCILGAQYPILRKTNKWTNPKHSMCFWDISKVRSHPPGLNFQAVCVRVCTHACPPTCIYICLYVRHPPRIITTEALYKYLYNYGHNTRCQDPRLKLQFSLKESPGHIQSELLRTGVMWPSLCAAQAKGVSICRKLTLSLLCRKLDFHSWATRQKARDRKSKRYWGGGPGAIANYPKRDTW